MNRFVPRVEINGAAAMSTDLAVLVQTNYGHFTAMRAQAGAVRGLDLHLSRLDQASWELFGTRLPADRVRGYLRHALGDITQPVSIRVNVFSQRLDRTDMRAAVPVDVLVIVAAATSSSSAPLRLKSFRYTRDVAAIKHVGTFALFHFRRLAQQAGFDDAVFVDESGYLGEGSIWNIGFADAYGVVWPDAPQLAGVSLQLLQRGLPLQGLASTTRRVHLRELPDLRCAFFSNASVPVRPIAAIDDISFRVDEAVFASLIEAYESNPWQLV